MSNLKKPSVNEIINLLNIATEDGKFFIKTLDFLHSNFDGEYSSLCKEYKAQILKIFMNFLA